MPAQRNMLYILLLTFVLPLVRSLPIQLSLDARSVEEDIGSSNVVVYWGQNSRGLPDSQQPLSYYCDSDMADIIVLSFLTTFFGPGGLPIINLGNACEGTYFEGSNLLSCPNVGADIKSCQAKGKKILLSLGGAVGAYGFTSEDEATQFADQLWNLFAGGDSSTRPFADAILDGFDLDIEAGNGQYYSVMVERLQQYFALDKSKSFYMSAAPQCPCPDVYIGNAIVNSHIDWLFVQFYNNYCQIQPSQTGATSPNFNYDEWDVFVKTQAMNHNAKIFLGVPGSPSAAGSGYVPAENVVETANNLQSTYPSFGGVMIWDASQAWANIENSLPFVQIVKDGLTANAPPPSRATSSILPLLSTELSSIPVVPVTISSLISLPVATISSTAPLVSSAASSVWETTLSNAFARESTISIPASYSHSHSSAVPVVSPADTTSSPQVTPSILSSTTARASDSATTTTPSSFVSASPVSPLQSLPSPTVASSFVPTVAPSLSHSHASAYAPQTTAGPLTVSPASAHEEPLIITPSDFHASARIAGPFYSTLSNNIVEEYYSYFEPDIYVTRYSYVYQ